MIICICKNINQEKIQTLLSQKKSKTEIIKDTGVTTCCGCCINVFEKLIKRGEND